MGESSPATPTRMDRPLSARDRRLRKLLRLGLPAGAAVVVAGLALALATHREAELNISRDRISIATARSSAISDSLSFSGRVVPTDLVQVDAAEGGRIDAILVQSGDRVAAGQPLVRLSNAERELMISGRIAQIEADINNLRGQETQLAQAGFNDEKSVMEAEHNLQKAEEELTRHEVLASKDLVADANVKPYRDEVAYYKQLIPEIQRTTRGNDQVRKAQLAAIRQQYSGLGDNLNLARRQLSAFTIVAPTAGMVIGLSADPGATIAPGAHLAQIDPATGLKVEAQIDEFYANQVQVGEAGTATLAGQQYDLKVSRIYPEVKDGTFRIDLVFATAPPRAVRPGETVQGQLRFGTTRVMVVVPNGPFMQKTNGSYVYVVSPDGKTAAKRNIRTGARTPESVAVVEGLRPGERVITSEYESFGDAASLRLH